MALHDVTEVFVVQDRETGAFIDINMTPVTSLRHAARCESRELARECVNGAIYEGLLFFSEGYEIHPIFELLE